MASTFGLEIAKAGWLYRRSSILHRWKKNWFVLDRQGDLRYFESPDTPKAEERIVVRASVVSVKADADCRRYDPPEGLIITRCAYLKLVMRDTDALVLCSDSPDDIKAWQIAIEEARSFMSQQPVTNYVQPAGYVHYVNNPYTPFYPPGYMHSYPGQVISAPGTHQVIHTPTGMTTISTAVPPQQLVIVDDDPYRYRRRNPYHRNFWW